MSMMALFFNKPLLADIRAIDPDERVFSAIGPYTGIPSWVGRRKKKTKRDICPHLDNDVLTKIGLLVVESRLERDREYWIDRFKTFTGWKMRIDEWGGEVDFDRFIGHNRLGFGTKFQRIHRKEIGNGQYEGGGASYEAQVFMIKRGFHLSIKYMDVENGVKCKDIPYDIISTFKTTKKDVQWEWGSGYNKVSHCGKCFTRGHTARKCRFTDYSNTQKWGKPMRNRKAAPRDKRILPNGKEYFSPYLSECCSIERIANWY